MKKFVLFVMLMMCVVSVNAQRWSLTPEVGMTAISRGGGFYSDEQKWNSRWKMGVGVRSSFRLLRRIISCSLSSNIFISLRINSILWAKIRNFSHISCNPSLFCIFAPSN